MLITITYDLLLLLVALHLLVPAPVELLAEAQGVLDDDLLEVLDAALQVLQPLRGAREGRRREGVVHEDAVDVPEALLLAEVVQEERRVFRRGAVVAADVEVVANHRGHKADVLLGTR